MAASEGVGIVSVLGGTGALGRGLAARLASQGTAVCIGSRSESRARTAAAEIREHVSASAVIEGATNAAAVRRASALVVLAVPLASHVSLLAEVVNSWRHGQVVLDTTVPLAPAIGGRPTQMVGLWHGSAAEQARAHIPPSIGVVSGLHTLSAATLWDLNLRLDQDALICGDRKIDKAVVARAFDGLAGLRLVDAGRLEMSRITESVTALLIGINIRNKTHSGLRITGLSPKPHSFLGSL